MNKVVQGPSISVINYNNPTINMNFSEQKKSSKAASNFLTSPTHGKLNFEENSDFYESLNYSNNQGIITPARAKNNNQTPIKTIQK